MREINIVVNKNCKTQAHARVHKENKLEEELLELELEEKKTTPIKSILQLRCEFEGSYKKSGETHQDDILKDDSPYHKSISTVLS